MLSPVDASLPVDHTGGIGSGSTNGTRSSGPMNACPRAIRGKRTGSTMIAPVAPASIRNRRRVRARGAGVSGEATFVSPNESVHRCCTQDVGGDTRSHQFGRAARCHARQPARARCGSSGRRSHRHPTAPCQAGRRDRRAASHPGCLTMWLPHRRVPRPSQLAHLGPVGPCSLSTWGLLVLHGALVAHVHTGVLTPRPLASRPSCGSLIPACELDGLARSTRRENGQDASSISVPARSLP
jgi:hypothetical protein